MAWCISLSIECGPTRRAAGEPQWEALGSPADFEAFASGYLWLPPRP